MLREQGGGLVERLLVVVVAVDRVDELDVGVVGLELGLHQLDPGVLVGGVGRGAEDRDLAGAADLLRDHLDLGLGDALGVGLVDEHVAALGVGVGVEGDHLDAGVPCLLERVADRGRVVGRDDERAHTLLRGGVDERHLRVGGDLVGPDLLDAAAELVRGPLAAGGAGVEVGVAEVLGQERDGAAAAILSPPPPPSSSSPHAVRPRPATRTRLARAASRCLWIFIVSCLSLTCGRETRRRHRCGPTAVGSRPWPRPVLPALRSTRRPRTGSWWR